MPSKKVPQSQPAKRGEKDPTISAMFVFGKDENGQARGARFLEAKSEIELAAKDLGLQIVKSPVGAFAELAMKLPLGRMYASGKAFIPNIRADLHAKLLNSEKSSLQAADAAEVGIVPESLDNLEGIPDKEPYPPLPTYPALAQDWQNIDIDHLVLLHGGATVGWWEAVVVQRQQNILTLRLRDYPQQGLFLRHRFAVALTNPGKASPADNTAR